MTNHLRMKIHSKETFDKARERVEHTDWAVDEKSFHLEAISALENLETLLRKKEIAISNLKSELFGNPTEKFSTLFDDIIDVDAQTPEPASPTNPVEDMVLALPAAEGESKECPSNVLNFLPNEKKKKGSGKRKLSCFAHVESTKCKHETHAKGGACPVCTKGHFYPVEPRTKTCIRAINLIVVQEFVLEALRCSSCGTTETAAEPETVKECYGRYHPSAIATLATLRYAFGMPSHRLEAYTEIQGLRVPETTQFMLFEYAYSKVKAVYNLLVEIAANGKVSYRDNSPMKINSLKKELDESAMTNADTRVGIATTAFHSVTTDGHEITLYATGNSHAGEVYDDLLKKRNKSLPPMLAMADAASLNRKHSHQDITIELACLVHARRNFVKLKDYYPGLVKDMLALFGELYAVESEAKQKGLSDVDRLILHKEKSLLPLHHIYLTAQIGKTELEPSHDLVPAYQYIENHWPRLIGFIKHAGAPLDNSQVERSLKWAIRHRRNSLFYATEYGALIGDVLMSMIRTAQNAGRNPIEYLTTLMLNSELVKKQPDAWLPWCSAAQEQKAS